MPIYNFLCEKCKTTTEKIVSLGVEDIECTCGGKAIKQYYIPNKVHFQLLYDPKKDICSWGAEGYSRTQRYREYDKMAKHNIYDMGEKKK